MDFFSVHNFVDAGHPNLRGGRQKFFLPFCYEWEPQHCSYCTVECSSSQHWNLRLLAMERSCTDFLSPWLEHLEKDGNFVAENAVVQPLTCLPISLRHPRFEWRCTSWPVSGVCWLFFIGSPQWRQISAIGSITNCGDWWCRPDKHGITTRSPLPKRNAAPKIRVLGRGGKILMGWFLYDFTWPIILQTPMTVIRKLEVCSLWWFMTGSTRAGFECGQWCVELNIWKVASNFRRIGALH